MLMPNRQPFSYQRANLLKFCKWQVGSIVNLSLMYLLAPTAATAAGKSMGFIERLFSDQILRSWGAPTGHMFERGYPFASRVVNLGYKVSSLVQYPIHVKCFLKL